MAKGSNFIVRGGADFSEIERKMQGLQKKMKNAGKKMTDLGMTLTKTVTLPIAAAGAASFQMAADMEDAMGAADQIFKNSSGEITKWAKGLESYYGIAQNEALAYANTMGAMLQNIGGLSADEAAAQAQKLVELAGDLTAMYGGDTQSAVQALTGALKGNNSMLDNYGMGVNDATIKAKALEIGLSDGTGQLTLQAKQAATLALIMEQTAAAQGQASRESKGASGSLRSLKTEVKNLGIMIGQELLPIITPMLEKLKEWIEKFSKLKPETKEMIVKAALFAAAVGPVVTVLGKTTTAMSGVLKLAPKLVSAFSGMSTAAVAAGGAAGIGKFAAGLSALLGPGGLIALAIAGLVALGIAMHEAVKEYPTLVKTADQKAEKLGPNNGYVPPKDNASLGFGDFKALASGGIVTRPTYALIGEAGPEAVVPLGKGLNSTINHTGTITIKGVNNKDELIGATKIALDNLNYDLARQQRRNKG